jgi:hypothetical protein
VRRWRSCTDTQRISNWVKLKYEQNGALELKYAKDIGISWLERHVPSSNPHTQNYIIIFNFN